MYRAVEVIQYIQLYSEINFQMGLGYDSRYEDSMCADLYQVGKKVRTAEGVRIRTAIGANPVHDRLFCEPS